ncbi:OmpA family protein [Mucilaginibacter glaciei]|uniref:OmpA family protein n=1 Tax=Mucilaginibacter glaciei TaxID=2772109 RepID=A0A926NPK5_9SPHI|nr:OmpA family protein [Mucilaginibacter glaciei]MBD1392300.1 OmpA family protein [Mucilaginibacter glaciei]
MKNSFYALLLGSLFLTACGNKSAKNSAVTDSTSVQTNVKDGAQTVSPTATATSDSSEFDINKIPVSTKDIGKFPYLTAPEGYRFNDFTKSDLETLHFGVDSKLLAVEGKTFKSNIYKNDKETPFNVQIVSKAYENAITTLGGVQISSKILPGEIDKIGKGVLEKENHSYGIIGANEFTLNHVNTYVIRTADAEVWIELSFWENGGYINILKKGSAEIPTVSIIKSDVIKNDLDKTGKATVYINFDIDKSTLLPDGIKAVDEITTVLKNDPTLKLSIEGHTDNSGKVENNKTLSTSRATTVLETLVKSGISVSRLKAAGYGSSKPIADNTNEAGKAKNRRVELVKL